MTIDPPPPATLSGQERFRGLDASVSDFWRFAMSDLRINNVRGYLAEFLVAEAVGATSVRVEWDPWDVTAPDGTRIEVKSSGYLQAWTQNRLSAPSFRVAPAYGWDAQSGAWSIEQGYNADVYVFALHIATSHEEYDPLDTTQWAFSVCDRATVASRRGRRMGVPALRVLAGEPVTYAKLADTIAARSAPPVDR